MTDHIILICLRVMGAVVVLAGSALLVFEMVWSLYRNIKGLQKIQKAMIFYRDNCHLPKAKFVVMSAREVVRMQRVNGLAADQKQISIDQLCRAVDAFDSPEANR